MSGWMRNYHAMSEKKIMDCVEDFRRGYGPAVDRVQSKGGSIEDNQAKCEYEARLKGLIDSTTTVANTHAKTGAKFCPECEHERAFYVDDYVCVKCREEM